MSYQTLLEPVSTSIIIKKSEFISFAYPVSCREQAMFHVEQLKIQYPDARHHCSAYIIGDPKNTTSAGFDDDAEPSGTAGRPILNVLQHKAIGNIVVVVVRYFGGIKLGAGGLTRAYAQATQAVVDMMHLAPYQETVQISLQCPFGDEAYIRHLIDSFTGEITQAKYGNEVSLYFHIPIASLDDFKSKVIPMQAKLVILPT